MLFINIFVLLVSLFSINFNTNDSISFRDSLRSINTVEEVVHLPVPNSGYVDKIYVNTSMSKEEIASLVSQLTYTDGDYIVANNSNDLFLMIINDEGILSIMNYNDYLFAYIDGTTELSHLGFSGWNPDFNGVIEANTTLVDGVGTQNNLLTSLFSITPFDNVDDDVSNKSDYDKGYQDGYNAANNTSVFSPDNLQLVFTLPVNYGNSSDIAYWPVDRDIFSNWFSGGSFDFISTSFFNEWLDFYNDTQDPLIDLNEFYTFTMFLDFNSPVSIYDLSFEGFGFSAWAYEYSSTSSLIWNYAQASSDREYYFKSPTLIRNEDTSVASLLVKSIYLQFTMNLGNGSVSSNVLKFIDTSIDDYNQGFILGQESGFNSGFNAGQQDGLKQGFNDGYTEAENYYINKYDILKKDFDTLLERYNSLADDQWNLRHLFWSIGSVPFETFKQIWNFEFLGYNLAGFITRIFY